jgi:PPOX class probable F420-dependent enzyme
MATMSDPSVKQLLSSRHIASFATHSPDGSIHMVAVWFWSDGKDIFVATSSRTRKAQNLQASPKATLMIDSRDPDASYGATITGIAKLLTGDSSRKYNEEIHRKYLSDAALADPRVGPVFAGFDDVTVQLTPASVITWDMRQLDQQAFGGVFKSNPTYFLPVER